MQDGLYAALKKSIDELYNYLHMFLFMMPKLRKSIDKYTIMCYTKSNGRARLGKVRSGKVGQAEAWRGFCGMGKVRYSLQLFFCLSKTAVL